MKISEYSLSLCVCFILLRSCSNWYFLTPYLKIHLSDLKTENIRKTKSSAVVNLWESFMI